jgi:hypothetical protein
MLGVEILINFDLAASAMLKINPLGVCIFVSCSSPVTGFLKLSSCTSMIPGTEKLFFLSSILAINLQTAAQVYTCRSV